MKSLKKLLAVVLSLAMVLGTMTVTSLAAEGTAITTAAELATALAGSSDCYLANDITLDSTWSKPTTTAAITLDMNGFSIDGNGATDRFCNTASSTSSASKVLTISNSSSTVSEIKGFAISSNKYLFYVQGGLTIGKNVKITNNTCTNIATTSTATTTKTITINGEISGNNVGDAGYVITVGSAASKNGNAIVVGSGAKIQNNTCKYDVYVPGNKDQTTATSYTQTAGYVDNLYKVSSAKATATISGGYIETMNLATSGTYTITGGHFGVDVSSKVGGGYSCIAPTKQAEKTYKYDVVKSDSTYTISYFDGDTEYTDLADTQTCAESTGFTVAAAQTKTDYNFDGWNTKADGSGEDYEAGAEIAYVGAKGEAIKLYAQWVDAGAAPRTVTYFDETTPLSDLTQNSFEGETVKAQEAPEKPGYVFKSWNTQADGKGTSYAAGADIVLDAEDVVLYAQYSEAAASVTVGDAEPTVYSSLYNALNAAGSETEATITVLKDCVVATRGALRTTDAETQYTTRNFTIDLNGKTVTNKSTNGMFIINKNTTVTIGGGTINSENPKDGTNPYIFYGNTGSTVIIEDGTYNTLDALKGGNTTLSIKGGTFNVDPTAFLAAGYEAIPDADPATSYTVEAKKVASVTIGESTEKYLTLEDACAAAVNATTTDGTSADIKLLADATVSARIALCTGTSMTNDTVKRTLNLDLNGKTITASAKLNGIFGINKNGTLNVSDSSEDQTGAIVATSDMTYYIYFPSSASKLNISGGTWKGAESATIGSANGAPVVTGGMFDFDPSTDAKAVVTGDVEYDEATSLYTVTAKKAAEVTIDGTAVKYDDFTAAWEAAIAASEATVKVLNDVDLTANMIDIPNGCALTLDLNGKTISTTKRFVQTYGDLTITDTTAEKAGAIVCNTSMSSSSFGIVQASYTSAKGTGTFTLEAGTIKAERSWPGPAVVATSTSGSNIKITIKGGAIEAYEGQTALAVRKGTGIVKAGTITGALDNASNAGAFKISGGVFSVDPTDYLDANFYEAQADTPEEGLFTVAVKSGLTAIATIDDVKYYTAGSAIDDILATEEKTATIVLTGATLDAPFEINDAEANITFDLDGNAVKPAANSRFINVSSAASITITNGTVLSNGVLSVAGLIYLKETAASLTGLTVNGDPTGGDTQTNTTKKNGTVYLMACDATFDNVTIKNCKAYDSAAMTGNSGAIHLVRNTSNNNKGTNLTMTNCIISNCASSVQGGAISVGSDCVLNLGSSNIIENCSSANGGAIFADVADYENADYACGVVNIDTLDIITNCAGTGVVSKAPIFSNGKVYVNEVLTNTGDVYQNITMGTLATYSLTLSDSLSFTFVPGDVVLSSADAGKELNVKVYEDDAATAALGLTASGMTVSGIDLRNMGTVFMVQFCVGDTPIENARQASVLTYCTNLATTAGVSDADKAIAANALAFGTEVQKYAKEGTAFEVPAELASFVTTTACTTTDKKTVTSTEDATKNKIKTATVNVDEKVAVVFQGVAEAGNTIVVKNSDGETVATKTMAKSGVFYIQADRISPTAYGDVYTAQILANDGISVRHAVQYSVNSYAKSMGADANVGALATAMYNYGLACVAQ